jgi:hypothetical protein
LQTAAREPGYSRNNPDNTQKHSHNKKGNNNWKERFFIITNIVKGRKVTDLTRLNELGTTTNKVTTRSLEITRL